MSIVPFLQVQKQRIDSQPVLYRSPTLFGMRFLTFVHLNDRDLKLPCWQEAAIELIRENTFVKGKIFAAQRIISWDSTEGMARSKRSGVIDKPRFWQVLRYAETQLPHLCGIASSVIILNTLFAPSRLFSQDALVQSIPSRKVCTPRLGTFFQEDVMQRGIALTELASVLEENGVKVTTFKAADLTETAIRKAILPALNHSNCCILALYLRGPLQEDKGGGHWSPLLAHDQKSDSFLLLDVNRTRYPPAWVNASAFIQAMSTRTAVNQWSRGFLILQKT